MILRELKKSTTTVAVADSPALTASIASLFAGNSNKQTAQAGGGGGSVAIHTPVSLVGGCPPPTPGKNVLGKAMGMVACYKIPGAECDPKQQCKAGCLRTQGPMIIKCQISGAGGG
ncbi:MAG: hypothetical protein WCO03_01945, partial [bacterium]